MDDQKTGVAVFVKTKMRDDSGWRDAHVFGGCSKSIADSLGYLSFLEGRKLEEGKEDPDYFYVQIGFMGWKKD